MKIHRVVQMLGATTSTGKLADDMYDLGHKDYYSEAQDRYIPISHMDFQHMVRAFVKQNDEVKHYKAKADGFEAKMNEYRSSYLSESDEVHEKEVEIGSLNTKINSLMKEYKDIKSFYEAKVAKLQVDINHFKNNK